MIGLQPVSETSTPTHTPPTPTTTPILPTPPPPNVSYGNWKVQAPPEEEDAASPSAGDMFAHAASTYKSVSQSLRSIGQKGLAEFIETQAQRNMRIEARANPNTKSVLRDKTEGRKRQIAIEREEDKAKLQRTVEKSMDLKIATEQRLAASHSAKEKQALAKSADITTKAVRLAASAEAKAQKEAAKEKEEKAKLAKNEEKKAQQAAAHAKEAHRRTFTGELAAKLVKFLKDHKRGKARGEALVEFHKSLHGKVPWKKVGTLPYFWDANDKRGVKCISPWTHFKTVSGDPHPIFASETFSWELWQGKLPEGASLPQLRKFVETFLPGYRTSCGQRFPVEELLEKNNYNADLSFMQAVWYYSALTPNDIFPCGLRVWPPAPV